MTREVNFAQFRVPAITSRKKQDIAVSKSKQRILYPHKENT